MDEDYNIYIKLTNACNMKCKHCYNAMMHNSQSMSDETLEYVKHWLRKFSKEHKDGIINVQIHGGEPLLFPVKKTIDLVQNCQAENIKWGITTNLVYPISDDEKQLFSMMLPYDDKPFIMTSWDHKIRFLDEDSINVSSKDIWETNVKYLNDIGVVVQPIVCVSKYLVEEKTPKELFQYFNQFNVKNVNFERLTRTGNAADGSLCPTNRQIDDWLFEAYFESKEQNVHVPLFESIEDSVKGFFNGCRARRCMQTVITINPDGNGSTCPNCANKTISKLTDVGLIETDRNLRDQLVVSEMKRDSRCYVCNKYRYCQGDCCQLIYDETGCPGLIKIYDYLLKTKK